MSTRKVFSTIIGIAVSSVVALASTQMRDQDARQQARDVVRSLRPPRAGQFMATQRDETLEHLLELAAAKPAESLFMYRISEFGEEIKEDKVIYHVSSDIDVVYIVAVHSARKISYRIHGFPDSIAEFNKLVTAVGVRVSSAEQAESLARFYRAVNPENMPLAPISSLLELKQAAERQCDSPTTSFDSGQKAFDAWWARSRRRYEAVEFQQQTVPGGHGYRVEWTVLSSPAVGNCGGAPLRATLEVGSAGEIGRLMYSPVPGR